MGRWCPPCNAAQTSVALSFTRYLLAFCQVCLLKLAATLIDIGNPTQIELNPGGMDSLPLHQWLHYSLMLLITCRQELFSSSIIFSFLRCQSAEEADRLRPDAPRGQIARHMCTPSWTAIFFFSISFPTDWYRWSPQPPVAAEGTRGRVELDGPQDICLGLGLLCQASEQFFVNQNKTIHFFN